MRFLRNLLIFASIFTVDFFSKFWVIHNLAPVRPFAGFPFGGIGVFKSSLFTLSIVHAQNIGAAWSLFSSFPSLLLIGRLIITLSILGYLCFFKAPKSLHIPFILILSGAFGNILDTFLYGHVVDMVYCIFYHYSFPIFNIADSSIFCGVAYLLIQSFRKKRAEANVT